MRNVEMTPARAARPATTTATSATRLSRPASSSPARAVPTPSSCARPRGASGVSHNAAYRHFADRDALLQTVCGRCMSALAQLMEKRIAEYDDGDRT